MAEPSPSSTVICSDNELASQVTNLPVDYRERSGHSHVLIVRGGAHHFTARHDESDQTDTYEPTIDTAETAGHTQGDIQVAPDGTMSLRAERAGDGPGRVYTLTFEAVDTAGAVLLHTGQLSPLTITDGQWCRGACGA